MKIILKRFLLIFLGIGLALFAFEATAGFLLKRQKGPLHVPMAEGTLKEMYYDTQLGFFPRVGEGGEYGPHGCLSNEYDVGDRKGRQRILFIGDSVTHRHMIVDALRELYGDQDFEYWNAGVGGFNTEQILELYRRHNQEIEPDHVVFTFHNNDFQLTPVAVEENGEPVLYIPDHPPMQASHSIIGRSALYRLWLRFVTPDYERAPEEVKRDVAELQRLIQEQGAKFSVVLFPILASYDTWALREQRSRRQALEILDALEIRYFDPLEALPEDLASCKLLRQEPDDTWHPSSEGGMLMAKFLHQGGLLDLKGE
ncbi:MAG: SGNH/GDSL hydrolase family protein [Vulcanimicrobiota bacterium]